MKSMKFETWLSNGSSPIRHLCVAEFEDLLKLPPEERLRLANWLIDSATNGQRGGSGSDSPRAAQDDDGSRAWAVLRSMTGTIEGPADWSQELDHYLYGAHKRGESNK